MGPILVLFYSFSTEFDTQCSVVALGTKCKIADLMNRDILRQAHLGVSLLPFGAVVSQWNFYNRQGVPVTATTQLAVLSDGSTINTINWPICIIGLFEY